MGGTAEAVCRLLSQKEQWVLSVDKAAQLPLFYVANGILSAVSDNVFVASVYISQINNALQSCHLDREQFDMLAIAINSGTNLPSVATPNGQAAFLFLLTSAIAPLVRLSYGRMFLMAIPYTIVLSVVGFVCTWFILPAMTDIFLDLLRFFLIPDYPPFRWSLDVRSGHVD